MNTGTLIKITVSFEIHVFFIYNQYTYSEDVRKGGYFSVSKNL